MTLATYIISVVTEVTVIPPALLAKTLLYRKPFSHQLFGYPEIVYQKKKKCQGKCWFLIPYSWPSLFMDSIFANSHTHWNLSVTPESIVLVLSWSFTSMCTAVKNFSCLMCVFPAEAEQGDALLSCSISDYRVLFTVCLLPCFCIFVLFVDDFDI